MTRLRARLAEERGTTLAEIMVVCALLGMVSIAIVTSMTSIVGVTASAEQRTAGIQDARYALEVLERDLRAANPIEAVQAPTPVSVYDTSVSFSIYCAQAGVGTCGSDHLRRVTYQVVANRFERVEGGVTQLLVGPSGPDELPLAQQRGAVVNAAGTPVFEYVGADGELLETSGAQAAPGAQFRNCTNEVRVHLEVVTESGGTAAPIQLDTAATIRNYQVHEVAGC